MFRRHQPALSRRTTLWWWAGWLFSAYVAVTERAAVKLPAGVSAAAGAVLKENVIPAGTSDISRWIQERKLRIDKAIDFVALPATFRSAVESGTLMVPIIEKASDITSNIMFNFSSPRQHSCRCRPARIGADPQHVESGRKQLDILGSYAGTKTDVEACLDLIANGHLVPQVREGKMSDFPKILKDLHEGKFKGRMVLVPDDRDAK